MAAVGVALALAGCSGPGATYAVFDRDAQPADEVPQTISAHAWEEADPATARFAGEHDETSVWITQGGDGARVCVVAYADEDAWVVACGPFGSRLGVDGLAGSFTVLPDGAPSPSGMTQVSENVYAPAGA